MRVAVKSGLHYPLVHLLVYYASNFAPVTPLNQAVALGFYDTPQNTVFVPSFIGTVIMLAELWMLFR